MIHKDVAQFLPRSRKIKATKKNCFLKKEGRFIPEPAKLSEPCYSLENDPKGHYGDFDLMMEKENREQFQSLIQLYLNNLL